MKNRPHQEIFKVNTIEKERLARASKIARIPKSELIRNAVNPKVDKIIKEEKIII